MKLLFKKGYRIYRVFPEDWEEIEDEITILELLAFKGGSDNKEQLEKVFTDPKNICLIAVCFDDEEEEICGYSSGGPLVKFKGRSRRPEIFPFLKNVKDEDVFHVYSTAVHPGYQGRGIGTRLTKIQIKEARKSGYKALTTHAMNDVIRRINEKLGFEEVMFIKNCGSKGASYMALILD